MITRNDVAILSGMALGGYVTLLTHGTYLSHTCGLVLAYATMYLMNHFSENQE